MTNALFIGIDIGSSSVKTSLFDAKTGFSLGRMAYPKSEQTILAPKPGWAEQDPEMWWNHFKKGFQELVQTHKVNTKEILGIGISYQMHGLVLVDKDQKVLRHAIIWCDSRAVEIGKKAFKEIGEEACLHSLLNSPGNFTASKLRWVQENEPHIYSRIAKFMLPGDFIAMKLSGEINTTETGLSEGVLWDFEAQELSKTLLNQYEISADLVPHLVPAIGFQSTISAEIAKELGLSQNVKITYRAGDQPNNAFSLNVLKNGEIAATAGTSGVIYAVTDKNVYDLKSRINTFKHVNCNKSDKRNGVLICVNGTGILFSWLKRLIYSEANHDAYSAMNTLATQVSAGSEGLLFYPFGNGAERVLENRVLNASIQNLDFLRHDKSHLIRAGMEGIAFALNLGFDILKSNKVELNTIRAGNSNLFLSKTFRSIFANVTDSSIEIFDTDGADGAARGAALGAGFYQTAEEAFVSLKKVDRIDPEPELVNRYKEVYQNWKSNIKDLV